MRPGKADDDTDGSGGQCGCDRAAGQSRWSSIVCAIPVSGAADIRALSGRAAIPSSCANGPGAARPAMWSPNDGAARNYAAARLESARTASLMATPVNHQE